MDFNRLTNEEFLYQSDLRIKGVKNNEEIQIALAKKGYTPEKMLEGETLLDSANTLSDVFVKEHGDVDGAFATRNAEKVKADDNFEDYVGLAQVALKNDAAAWKTLELNVRKPTTLSAWIRRTTNFYHNIVKNPEWLAEIAIKGVSKEMLDAGLAEVENVAEYAEVIMSEKGGAQQSTITRDNAFELLSDWVDELEKVAVIALKKTPQLLEKMGIVVKR